MTDLLLASILVLMLLNLHQKEKGVGLYGGINVLITKRLKRYLADKIIALRFNINFRR